jgi:hypothetical protein
MKEEAAEDLGDRKDPMPVRNGPEHMPAEPLAELHGAFLSAAGAELSLLTTEREEPFCAAGVAANAGKTCAQVATLQVMDLYPGFSIPILPLHKTFFALTAIK